MMISSIKGKSLLMQWINFKYTIGLRIFCSTINTTILANQRVSNISFIDYSDR